ncbi:MAG TPA: alpha-amylase/4-alpha-glucanotransferase domain-containing protein, partial [Bacteroidota bacterium]|nr:alpha-amylase/4-alpha-glucanotransferase domain-containing protein [Bacteroidota bacterium]
MTPLSFVFAIHNHQPVGNFDTVFAEAYEKAYEPFFDVLEKHPSVKLTQHWSGPLLEWIVRHRPELIERMKQMVVRGQLELLTGAYYEAILAMIPEEDRLGQIAKLTEFLHKTFGIWPRGMWLAERVWEPHLTASLVRAEVEYVMLDDSHFRHTGASDADLSGYYVTEELGETLKVLPMDRHLRYAIPFHTVPRTLEYLTERAKRFPGKAIVHADDGEKFGVWPKTHAHVYTEGWLEHFCQALEGASESVQTVRACDLIDMQPPLGRIYLPTDSYGEMTRWALPPQAQVGLEQFEASLEAHGLMEGNRDHVRGGFWRTFLAKYPEANQMQKRMLRVASRMRAVSREHRIPQEIRDHLWAGQCNDGYWHGLFGGLYLPSLRFTTYRHLIAADRLLDAVTRQNDLIIEEADYDGDGEAEVIVESPVINLYFKPSLGGCLIELDYKPSDVNLLDVLSRREEGNHRRLLAAAQGHEGRGKWDELLAKEPDLASHLVFDWYRHAGFLDHF